MACGCGKKATLHTGKQRVAAKPSKKSDAQFATRPTVWNGFMPTKETKNEQ